MIPILTAADMAETDRRTIASGISIDTLMENAGTAVAAFIERHYPKAINILILCGKGNNGGDGLVAARVLAPNSRRQITLGLLCEPADLKGPPAAAYAKLISESPIVHLRVLTDLDSVKSLFAAPFDLIVDAVVGTGFKPPLRGTAVWLRDELARNPATPVVAVDLPSGWDADSTDEHSPDAFRASAVVTFTAPKLAHVFGHLTPGATFGPVVYADIGSTASDIVSTTNLFWTGGSKPLTETARPIQSNKGKYGHVLVIGGSYGTAGAPSMSSLAALRAGAGLVTAAVPESILNLVAVIAPELMLAPLSQGSEGAPDLANLNQLATLTKKITVIAMGPGLSTKGDASEFTRQVLARTTLPFVLDADGLNAFDVTQVDLLNPTGDKPRPLTLTPHPGEFARLTGLTVKQVEADRLNLARDFATKHQLTLVLKGWRTLVAHPDGTVAVNTTGNPAMSKGGSGDILTGIVAAILGQFPEHVAEAVEAAVYLHGSAGDFAAHAMDEKTVLATDTVAHLSDAFRYRTRDSDGLTWIAGLHPLSQNSIDPV
jgi:NAD(P)H-hydrate epimerase